MIRPRLAKGAIAVYESPTAGSQPKIVVFQYNPEQLQRKIEHRAAKPKPGAKEDVFRVEGPPKETLTVNVVLSAADQLANPAEHEAVVQFGLHPALSTLEMLLYPSTFRVLQNQALMQAGGVQVKPAEVPLTLLILGASRVVPVQLEGITITEEAFDPALNPIQAKVELRLKVLTYLEFKKDNRGRDLYFSYQKTREELAMRHQFDDEAVRTVSGFIPPVRP
jgi:hypothetical protein